MLNDIESQLLDINIKNDIVILDVDRTIINTTSWYQACVSDNLLIPSKYIEKFKSLNDKTFENPTTENLKRFREDTLKLIEKNISNEFLEKISGLDNTCKYFYLDQNTDDFRFYVSGIYTARYLVQTYEDVIKFIKFLRKYYGNNLKIIFLTSGYEPFIRGVVDEIISYNNLKNLNYIIIGSKIKFENGKAMEKFNMNQDNKEELVDELIRKGAKIKFLADDSNDNINLFKKVRENEGVALHIKHKSNQRTNITWSNYIKDFNFKNIKTLVKNDSSCSVSLNSNEIELPKFLKTIDQYTKNIGIMILEKNDFDNGLDLLIGKIKNENSITYFEENIKKLTFIKENKVYTRGMLYYNRMPGYILLDNKTVNQRWKELINTCKQLLEIIDKENLLKKELTIFEKLLIYSVIDNLLEASFYILNLIEMNSLKGNLDYEKEYTEIKRLTQNVMDFMYVFFMDDNKDITKKLKKIYLSLNALKIIRNISEYSKIYKSMRELDNNIIIFKTVKSIVDQSINKKIDYVISFPYGGIALSFAVESYLKVFLNKKELPKILNCHYSSKQKLRENKMERDIDFSIFNYIPKQYIEEIKEIKKGRKNILLVDNNVTTFKTLEISKSFLNQLGNRTYCAVSSINYDNIAKYLLNETSEILVNNWRNVLDFHPVEEYVTAFNTWKTSAKTRILEQIFFEENRVQEIKIDKIDEIKKRNFIFKVCRIQNIFDLNTAIMNNVNMIGIHAVYPDRIKYLKNEEKYNPIRCNLEVDNNLPIGVLELDSIREMQTYIPKNMKQAILFEKNYQ